MVGLEGHYELSVDAAGVQDAAGNQGSGTATSAWTMDLTPPEAPTGIVVQPDTGISAADGLLNTLELRISGNTPEDTSRVQVKDAASGLSLGSVSVQNGVFSMPIRLSVPGLNPLGIMGIDAAGNYSEPTEAEVFVDLSRPVAEIEPVVPNPRSSALSEVEVVFNEPINGATFDRHDVTLSRDGVMQSITDAVQVEPVDPIRFRIRGLAALTDAIGSYVLAIKLVGLEDSAGNTGQGLAEATWRRTEPNRAPVLDPIADYTIGPATWLVITNTASDQDIPPNNLEFALAAGAPRGATVLSDTGVFRWRPTLEQAPGVYSIGVVVTDDGDPPLNSEQRFTVTVRDFAVLSFGSTITEIGHSGGVLIGLVTSAAVNEIRFHLPVPLERFGELALQILDPKIEQSWLNASEDGGVSITLRTRPGWTVQGTIDLAELHFLLVPDQPSAFVPLRAQNLQVRRADGALLTDLFTARGRIVAIGVEPLAEATQVDAQTLRLTIFGHPGQTYDIEQTGALRGPIAWEYRDTVTLPAQQGDFELPIGSEETLFFRVVGP